MANYTIYHPLFKNQTPTNPRFAGENTNITDLLAHELKRELSMLGHKVNISYINFPYDEGKTIYIEELDIHITSHNLICDSLWFMLANEQTKKFVVVDMQDSPAITSVLDKHPNYVMSLVSQYSLERYNIDSPDLNFTKLLPFVYFAYYPKLVESKIQEIQDIRTSSQLDNRVFFYGNNRDTYRHSGRKIREVISLLELKYPDEVCVGGMESKLPPEEFFKKAATHTINLALPGHPWCSREHELWTLGLPVMMYEHTHHLAIDLIPNYHYIAVPVGRRLSIGMPENPELAADNIIKAHRIWLNGNNRWRLDNIARNGQRRILKEASPTHVMSKLIELLQLGYW
jgi:hypothetical protein